MLRRLKVYLKMWREKMSRYVTVPLPKLSCKHPERITSYHSECLCLCICQTHLFQIHSQTINHAPEPGKLIYFFLVFKYHLCSGHNSIDWSRPGSAVRGQLHCNLMTWWMSSMVIYCSCTKCLLRKVDTGGTSTVWKHLLFHLGNLSSGGWSGSAANKQAITDRQFTVSKMAVRHREGFETAILVSTVSWRSVLRHQKGI